MDVVEVGYYYSESLSGKKLERCYQIAPPRVVQYFESEIRFVNTYIENGFRVLELGSGYGRALSQFVNNTQRIIGIDISIESLRLAKQMVHFEIEMIQTNAINLPFQKRGVLSASKKLIKELETINGKIGQQEALKNMADQLAATTGQRPIITNAKQSIAGFKLRAGDPIGLKVTLRGQRMYDYFEKLVSIALPRVRDFQGTKRSSFDGQGNYSLGLTEQLVFPEVDYDKIDKVRGLEISITTTTSDDKKAMRLLDLLGMPFEKEKKA